MRRKSTPPLLLRGERPCDLCGEDEFQLLASVDRLGLPLDTVLCVHCGLVSHRVIPDHKSLAQFYASEYRSRYHRELTPSARRVMRSWRRAERLLARLRPYLGPNDHVLDVGAGIGCTVKRLLMAGYRTTGIEPGRGFVDFSRHVLRAPVENASLEDIPPQPAFDVIILTHVIEHLASPTAAMERARVLLRPRGRVYLECPNLAAPFASRHRLFHQAHLHNFTPHTLAILAVKTGFVPVAWLAGPRHPILRVLLEKGVPRTPSISMDAANRTRDALRRAGPVAYYLRPGYLAWRAVKLAQYAWETVAAPRYVRALLHRIDSEEPRVFQIRVRSQRARDAQQPADASETMNPRLPEGFEDA